MKLNLFKQLSKNVLLKNISYTFISNTMLLPLSIITSVIIVRNMSIEDFGYFSLFVISVNLFAQFSLAGLKNYVIREISKSRRSFMSIYKRVVTYLVAPLTIFLIISSLYSWFFLGFDILLIGLLFIGIVLTFFYQISENSFYGLEDMKTPAYVRVVFQTIWTILILSVDQNSYTLKIITLLFISNLLLKSFCINFLFLRQSIAEKTDEKLLKNYTVQNVFKNSRFFLLTSYLTLLSINLPVYILEFKTNISQVSLFTVTERIVGPLRILQRSINTSFLSFWSRKKINENSISFVNQLKKYFFVTITLIATASIISDEIIRIFYSEKYFKSGVVLYNMFWFLGFYSVASFIGTYNTSKRKENLNFKINLAVTLFSLTLFLLFSSKGVEAFSIIYKVSGFIYFIFYLLILKKVYQLNLNKFIDLIIFSSCCFAYSFFGYGIGYYQTLFSVSLVGYLFFKFKS